MKNGSQAKLKFLVLFFIFTTTQLFADTPKAKPKVTTWILDSCPVNPSQQAYSGAGAALIALGVNKLVDFVGNALTKAAEKDKNGVAVSGKNASYMYEYDKVGDSIVPLNCLVVAISTNDITKWYEKGLKLENGKKPEILSLYKFINRDFLSSESGNPNFYAEIMLHEASDGTAIYPQLRTLYYPKKIPGGIKSKKKRDLIIKVGAETVSGKSAINTIAIHIKGVKPGEKVYTRTANSSFTDLQLGSLETWTNKLPMPKTFSKPGERALVFPVNFSTEIRELGKPNAFLQWFAKYFDENKDKLKKEE